VNKIIGIAVALGVVAGCRQDQSNLERKVDALGAQLASIEKRLASGGDRGAGPGQPPPRAKRPEPSPTQVFAVPIADLPTTGPADALVTIVEGYEYACPACNGARASVAQMLEQYGDKVRVVYKPYIVHPDTATNASITACAAHAQGKFAAMDKLLWEKAYAGREFGADRLEVFAKEAGLDLERYRKDIAGPCKQRVAQLHAEQQSFGQGATPTFYINGRYLVGAAPAKLKALIDAELALAQQRVSAGTKPADYYQTWVLGKGLPRFDPGKPAT